MNTFDYLKKYGNVSFLEKEFNEIDAGILATVSYIDFAGIVNKKKVLMGDALKSFIDKTVYKEFLKHGLFQKDLYELAKELMNAKRFSTISLYNYTYIISRHEQMGAITMKLPNNIIYISFEGTDEMLSAWEEDFVLAYKYPVLAHTDAIKYLNQTIGLFDKTVYVGGHSKGGNLALVAAMNANFWNKNKIKKVYSFDGPGLKNEEFKSESFKKILPKYWRYVPNHSVVGMLLKNKEDVIVVKSPRVDLYAHELLTWEVNDSEYVRTSLSDLSKKLNVSINEWLDNHSVIEKKHMIKDIFSVLHDMGYMTLMELNSPKAWLNIFKHMNDFEPSTRSLLKNLIVYNTKSVIKK